MPPQIADNDDTPSLAEWLRQIPGVYPWLYVNERANDGAAIERHTDALVKLIGGQA